MGVLSGYRSEGGGKRSVGGQAAYVRSPEGRTETYLVKHEADLKLLVSCVKRRQLAKR
ncbi:hypothetical protein E2C01_077107 [Portunus trituberculatus]|uniref:Uncharacterized protein n=1 Tax=Portunus trituberculatus TaxID=210409 RepID=A0A5B7IKI8_PORTR|nr:hypothetical protein [Portunus trituberculatus]